MIFLMPISLQAHNSDVLENNLDILGTEEAILLADGGKKKKSSLKKRRRRSAHVKRSKERQALKEKRETLQEFSEDLSLSEDESDNPDIAEEVLAKHGHLIQVNLK